MMYTLQPQHAQKPTRAHSGILVLSALILMLFGSVRTQAQCGFYTQNAFSTFNNSAIASNSLWVTVHVQLTGQLSVNGDYILYTGGALNSYRITSTPTISNIPMVSGKIIADNTVSAPSTTYNGTMWVTRVPVSYSNSNLFIAGTIINSSNGFTATSGKYTQLNGYFYTNKTSLNATWWYNMAVYQPQMSYSSISAANQVYPVLTSTKPAGTPSTLIANIKTGGSGTGGTNYIGNSSSVQSISACQCTNPTVAAITGTTTVCSAATTQLSNATAGGTWSSSNTAVATVSSSGLVSGVTAGTATIYYSVTNSCGTTAATATITVNSAPSVAAITGTTTVCKESTTSLSCATAGGTWASANTAVAEVNSSGVVTGKGSGTTTISYTVSNSCGSNVSNATITVNEPPSVASITGTTTVCPSNTTTLACATAGGTWSSSNTAVATVNSSGVVSGVSVGSATISYTVSNSCGSTAVTSAVTVANSNPSVAAISGTSTICPTATTTLTCATAGGVWSSGNTAVATVNASGVVTGVSTGTAVITYRVTNSCGTGASTITVTVANANPTVAAITGTSSICPAATTTLSCVTSNGVWSSSNTNVATVNSSGVVTGVAYGTATISYTVTNSCGSGNSTLVVTVSNLNVLEDISGLGAVCTGSSISLTNATPGGSWSSSNAAVASVNASGVVTGVSTGSVTISYTLSNSCGTNIKTHAVTVGAVPVVEPLTSPANFLCTAGTITLTAPTAGGTWSSNNTAVATVNSSGVVSGVSTGGVTISYAVTNSCGTTTVTKGLTVNTVPVVANITGDNFVYTNLTTVLSNATNAGVWSSSNNAVAVVNSSGVVTGVTPGNVIISYTVSNTCGNTDKTLNMTVSNLAPNAINDTVSTQYSVPVNINAASNDEAGSFELSPNTLVFVAGTAPNSSTVGTFVNNNDGSVTFTPVATFDGIATIQYRISDAGSQNTTGYIVVNVSGPCSVDGDADGVPDCLDDYPSDVNKAFNNYYPAVGYSSLFFEDEWPHRGDYDLNDVVVDYRSNTVTNGNNNVVEITYSMVLRCSGAGLHNGFAFQLDNVSPNKITSVSGTKTHNAPWLSNAANGTENGQTYANIVVFDNVYQVLIYPGSGNFLNTYMTSPKVPYDTSTIVIKFIENGVAPVGGTISMSSLPSTAFNPYLILGDTGSFDQIRSKEVHLPDRVPSSKMDVSWFGKADDTSLPAEGRYYRNKNNLPWGINVANSTLYMQEKQDISTGYLHFIEWAQSNGLSYTDWYLPNGGYRNNSKLYTK